MDHVPDEPSLSRTCSRHHRNPFRVCTKLCGTHHDTTKTRCDNHSHRGYYYWCCTVGDGNRNYETDGDHVQCYRGSVIAPNGNDEKSGGGGCDCCEIRTPNVYYQVGKRNHEEPTWYCADDAAAAAAVIVVGGDAGDASGVVVVVVVDDDAVDVKVGVVVVDGYYYGGYDHPMVCRTVRTSLRNSVPP